MIQQISELKQISIIAVSANTLELEQEKSKIAGCNAFLSKPIHEDKLLPLFETYLKMEWVYDETKNKALTQKQQANSSFPHTR